MSDKTPEQAALVEAKHLLGERLATLEERTQHAAAQRADLCRRLDEIAKQNQADFESIHIELGKIRIELASRSWVERLAWLVLGSMVAAIISWTKGWTF